MHANPGITAPLAVIPAKAGIQYSAAVRSGASIRQNCRRRLLDHPLSRMMTTCDVDPLRLSDDV
jgi:hypothetical protein